MAIANVHNFSGLNGFGTPLWRKTAIRAVQVWAFAAIVQISGINLSAAAEVTSDWASKRAEKTYQQLREQWQKKPTDTAVAVDFSHACFDWAEFAQSNPERRKLAEEGMEAARQALNKNPKLGGSLVLYGS